MSVLIKNKIDLNCNHLNLQVAPDHQDVKNVINSFTQTLHSNQVNFFGNVNIGTDLRIADLTRAYDCVVLAYGSASEKYLNIPGEKDFDNLVSAKDFVSWYNGLPQSENFNIDLSAKQAVIIGAGNVAIDVARILLSPIEKLEKTDITVKALDLIKNTNKVEHVSIVARRGILNAAFTIKELRELTKIESVQCDIDLQNFNEINVENILNRLSRPRKRITELMFSLAKQPQTTQKKKKLSFVFLKTPLEIVGDKQTRRATGVKFQNSKYNLNFMSDGLKLDSEDMLNSIPVVEDTQRGLELMNCGLVVRSIGFKNVNIDPEIPFDKKSGVVLNEKGKVIGKDGLYCTGWIKRGPRGVIVDTTTDAHETARKLCEDFGLVSDVKRGGEEIAEILHQRGVHFVDKEGWRKIDEEEVRRGKVTGKPREKFQTIDEMLQVALAK